MHTDKLKEYLNGIEEKVGASSNPKEVIDEYGKELCLTLDELRKCTIQINNLLKINPHIRVEYLCSRELDGVFPVVNFPPSLYRIKFDNNSYAARGLGALLMNVHGEIRFLGDNKYGLSNKEQINLLKKKGIPFREI